MPNININSIPANTVVYISGIVDYSRITSHIEGKELDDDNARRMQKGMRAVEKPHTRMSITNAAVMFDNINQPSLAEQYMMEKIYKSKAHPEKGDCYTGMNKSKNLPEVYCRDNINSTALEQVIPEGEIAAGTNVTLMLRFFATKQNNGVSLDAVIVNQKPVKYGSGNSTANTLAERGFTVTPAASADIDAYRAQLDANPAPAPVPAPPPVTQTAPASSSVEQAATPAASAIPTPPAPATNVAPAPVPASASAPAAVSTANLPVPPAGYKYDDNGRIVPDTDSNGSGGIKL